MLRDVEPHQTSAVDSTDNYWRALGIGRGERGKEQREAALKRAYELRSFEIDLFWKRATFFFAAQVAMFAALAVMIRFDQMQTFYALPVALLGISTSWLGWLSAQGAKFWQENRERHIDVLEDEIEGRLHKIVWLDTTGASYSVSRAQIAQSMCLLAFWLVMAAIVGFRLLAPIEPLPSGRGTMLLVAAGYLLVTASWGSDRLKSRFRRDPATFRLRTPPLVRLVP